MTKRLLENVRLGYLFDLTNRLLASIRYISLAKLGIEFRHILEKKSYLSTNYEKDRLRLRVRWRGQKWNCSLCAVG